MLATLTVKSVCTQRTGSCWFVGRSAYRRPQKKWHDLINIHVQDIGLIGKVFDHSDL